MTANEDQISPASDLPPGGLLQETASGLYCEAGNFYVDPWRPVARAILTHAHADHARRGSDEYLGAEDGRSVLEALLGRTAALQTLPYGETISLNGVRVSLHPAGHILGSAQVRLEYRGHICVISGDYKTEPDPTCRPFEVVRCHTFVTESTFGLPIYRWPAQESICMAVNDWWRSNVSQNRVSIVFAYALGKAQRVLAGLDLSIGPIYCHGAVATMNAAYRAAGVGLPAAHYTGALGREHDWTGALVIAPLSAMGSIWLRRFGEISSAFVSGWMLVRGARRRRTVDRGFPLSDHADWPALQETIRATGAKRVL